MPIVVGKGRLSKFPLVSQVFYNIILFILFDVSNTRIHTHLNNNIVDVCAFEL